MPVARSLTEMSGGTVTFVFSDTASCASLATPTGK
jgi:hypothetical protein